MAFFIGWELWQELSFVLACLIAIVFIIGFVKLWRTNRLLRRYELLDEEKRARQAEMQQYGIDRPAVNEIPFGSRAIQSGIEVDEIWISRPNTPAPSQRASSATTIDQGLIDSAMVSRHGQSSATYSSQGSCGKGKGIAQPPRAGPSNFQKRSTLSEQHFSELTTLDGDGSGDAMRVSSSEGINRLAVEQSHEPPQRHRTSTQAASDARLVAARGPSLGPELGPVPFGTAEVFVNTRTRRTVSGFEILPAGSLGKRVELHASGRHSPPFPKEEARAPSKLQKPRPNGPD